MNRFILAFLTIATAASASETPPLPVAPAPVGAEAPATAIAVPRAEMPEGERAAADRVKKGLPATNEAWSYRVAPEQSDPALEVGPVPEKRSLQLEATEAVDNAPPAAAAAVAIAPVTATTGDGAGAMGGVELTPPPADARESAGR